MDNIKKATRPDRRGCNNPMYQKHHSEATRQQMSQSHRQYQERVRQAMKGSQQEHITMDEFLSSPGLKECFTRIIREEIQNLYDNTKMED